jgi:MFS family permease
VFPALRSRNFRLLWLGSAGVNIGWWMHSVAMGWLIYDLTGSASWLGRVGFAQSVPTLLLGLVGGAVIEHADRRRVLYGSALVLAVAASILAGLTLAGVVEIWMIIGVSLLSGTGTALFMPVYQALIPALVPSTQLMNAISLNSISFNAARVVGPIVAGFVMSWAGLGWCFALNAAGSLTMVFLGRAIEVPPRALGTRPPLGRALLAGLDYARRHRVIRALLFLCVIMSLFGFPFVVLMAAYAHDVLGLEARGFTLLFSAVGIGAVAGGLILARMGDMRRKGLLVLSSATAFGILLILLGRTHAFATAAVTLAVLGFAMIASVASLNTVLQTIVKEDMRARVMSMLTVSLFGLPSLGAWILGAIADRWGIPVAYTLGGAAVATTAIGIALFSPDLRELVSETTPPSASGARRA